MDALRRSQHTPRAALVGALHLDDVDRCRAAVVCVSGDVLLEVRDLRTYFDTRRGVVKAVDGASFSVRRGETLGIVGESGSGKSMTCLSILRLVPEPGGRIVGGSILFEGEDLLAKSPQEMRQLRGARIAMILQDPMASLNPALTVGTQIAETLTLHPGLRHRLIG